MSSIGRGAELDRASGYLRVVDLERGAVTFRTPVPESRWRAEDPNPRGARAAGREAHAVPIPGDPPFARRLARIAPGRWLVGSQKPLALHAIDLEAGAIVETIDLQGDDEETVYAICELPDRFDEPFRPTGSDPYVFWKRAHLPAEVTPIPNSGR